MKTQEACRPRRNLSGGGGLPLSHSGGSSRGGDTLSRLKGTPIWGTPQKGSVTRDEGTLPRKDLRPEVGVPPPPVKKRNENITFPRISYAGGN